MAECLIANDATIRRAAEAIRAGRLVAFGTETVYGLGGDATCGRAVAAIFDAKGRPRFNPLISHLPSADDAFRHGLATPLARLLAEAFWPGAMTLILARHADCPISPLACADLDSIALRVPGNRHARDLLAAAGVPVAAPSANRSGHISPSRASHVVDDLGDCPHLDFVLDTGVAETGIESTVIDARGEMPVILRPGSITADAITGATGQRAVMAGDSNAGSGILTDGGAITGSEAITASGAITGSGAPTDSGALISPGQMRRHYAPTIPLTLNAREAGADVAWIGFGAIPEPLAACHFNLSPRGDLLEAAAELYHQLRLADQSGAKAIAIAPIPHEGIGAAINDRLSRAAMRG